MLFKGTHLAHRESDHVPIRIDYFHHLIVDGFEEIAFLALEDDLQVVAFSVVPELYVLRSIGRFTEAAWRFPVEAPPAFLEPLARAVLGHECGC
jgi:hypothetical protein